MDESASRIAAYYDRHADTYDDAMDRDRRNVRVRRAFQALVASTVPSGGTLLDFGCGTGVDAAWYASRGYSVIAYDNSTGMVARLTAKYASEISTGSIVPVAFPFTDFPKTLPTVALDGVVANFAVLNLVADLSRLFDQFAGMVKPGGSLIASVLSPFYWRDLLSRWWWRSYLAGRATGILRVDGGDSVSYRYLLSTIVRAAGPGFVLTRREGRASHFQFLVFRRVL